MTKHLAVIIALTGFAGATVLAQETSPSPAAQESPSPAKHKRAKKEASPAASAAAAESPAASPEASASPAKKKRAKKEASPAASAAMSATPAASASPAKHSWFSMSPSSGAAATPAAGTTKKTMPEPSGTVAPGGGHGMVWVNTESHVYHHEGSRWYGRTKKGKYMSEADAIKEGDHADKEEKH
ncbi:MAG TPA: hypothetical protein VEI58_03935 [Chthoniobacterales bacterium]|nr:hypothetical protein [Chthoniobacterales bacterium]